MQLKRKNLRYLTTPKILAAIALLVATALALIVLGGEGHSQDLKSIRISGDVDTFEFVLPSSWKEKRHRQSHLNRYDVLLTQDWNLPLVGVILVENLSRALHLLTVDSLLEDSTSTPDEWRQFDELRGFFVNLSNEEARAALEDFKASQYGLESYIGRTVARELANRVGLTDCLERGQYTTEFPKLNSEGLTTIATCKGWERPPNYPKLSDNISDENIFIYVSAVRFKDHLLSVYGLTVADQDSESELIDVLSIIQDNLDHINVRK